MLLSDVEELQSLALVEKATGKSRTFKGIVLAENVSEVLEVALECPVKPLMEHKSCEASGKRADA